MRVLFLTVYFPPEVGAPQARIYETARRFVQWGHEVTVLTAFPNHPTGVIPGEYRGKLFARETMDGMRVLRTTLYPAPNRGFWRWAAKHLSFSVTSLLASPLAGSYDIIVVGSASLFLGLTAHAISLYKRVPWVFTVADLWPATAVAQGQLSSRRLIKLTEALERFVYARADGLIGVTQGICDALVQKGVPANKVVHIPNGTDTDCFHPDPAAGEAARAALGLDGKFVLMYAGTMGLAQGLAVVLDAAGLLRDQPDIQFVLIGNGVEKPSLVQKAQRDHLTNVSFLDPKPRERVPDMLNAADAVLVTLRKRDIFAGALPSKTAEAMACGKPIIMTIMGEAAELLERAGAGIAVEPERPQALAEAVMKMKAQPELAAEMGRSGRNFALWELDRTALTKRLEELLLRLVNASSAAS